MASRTTIAQHGLRRETRQNEKREYYNFMRRWTSLDNMARDSQAFHTDHPSENNFTFSYSMNVNESAFVIFAAFLVKESTGRRYTNMRCWQMIIDSWLSGGGKQPAGARDNLCYIGLSSVVELASMTAMSRELAAQRSASQSPILAPSDLVKLVVVAPKRTEETVEITRDSQYWDQNTWLRCADRVAGGMSSNGLIINVSRAWIILDEDNDLHLVVELRQTAG